MSALLRVEGLDVGFPLFGGVLRRKVAEVHAVEDVSFTIAPGEVLGLVGESGSGKSTIGRAVCNLLAPTVPGVRLGGRVVLQTEAGEVDLNGLPERQMRPLRRDVQIVFQDPFSSLNPRMTVGQTLERPLQLHTRLRASARRARISELLDRVGMEPAQASRYPHEFSGGQRQRIGIARALATGPKLVVCDEPVSALDVSIQAQIVNLLARLRRELGLSYLFVAHDLGVVYHLADRIAVMYLGRIVELGTAEDVYLRPTHPYTQALVAAAPLPIAGRRPAAKLEGEIPSPLNRPSGCAFRTRCAIARPACTNERPPLIDVGGGHRVACPYSETLAPSAVKGR